MAETDCYHRGYIGDNEVNYHTEHLSLGRQRRKLPNHSTFFGALDIFRLQMNWLLSREYLADEDDEIYCGR